MKTKVCLVCLPFYVHVYSPPIQLAYLKAYLQQNDAIEVKTFDLEAYCFRSPLINGYADLYCEKLFSAGSAITDDIRRVLEDMVKFILAEDPAIVGFSTAWSNILFTRYVSQRIKSLKPDVFIIYGGITYCYRPPLTKYVVESHRTYPDVDCIVMNEGEATLLDVVESFAEGQRPPFCKGTTVRSGNAIVDCGHRDLIRDIDRIPFPDFSDFQKADYPGDYVRILFNRGCVGQCVFCADNYFKTARVRSARNIVDEIRLRINQGYTRFQSVDLCINPSIPRLEETCELIIQENLKVEFIFAQFRHSPHLSRKTFRLLRAAGFKTISFGTESASPRILDMMHKGVDPTIAQRNIRDAYAEGLSVMIFLMVGFPGETEETIRETMDWLAANAEYISAVKHIMPVTISHASLMYENPQAFGVDPDTLRQSVDSWETVDGKNTPIWRFDLAERMMHHLNACGIPMGELESGNIAAPRKDQKTRLSLQEVQHARLAARGRYIAQVTFSKPFEIIDRDMRFYLRLENSGTSVWFKDGGEAVHIGCLLFAPFESAEFSDLRMRLPRDIVPGESFETTFIVERRYLEKRKTIIIKFDLVQEPIFWFEDIGSERLVTEIEYPL